MGESTTPRRTRAEQCQENARLKSAAKRKAFLSALELQVREGKPLAKAAICRRAGVTAPFLRAHPDLLEALERAQQKRLVADGGSTPASSLDRGKDRIIEALKRQLEAKQAVIADQQAQLRQKDQEIRILLGKLAAATPAGGAAIGQLQSAVKRAEKAEARAEDLAKRLFAKRYVRVAGKVDRKWWPKGSPSGSKAKR